MKSYIPENPLVSILIPTRNRKSMLESALNSVINQTYKNLQIIVHDNNTSNLNENDINPNHDKRVEFYKSLEDLAMIDNWRAGLKYIKGKYFLRLDDDNILNPDYVRTAINIMQESNLLALTANWLRTGVNGVISTLNMPSSGLTYLSKDELTYMTFRNYIDTNYTLYDYVYLVNAFDKDQIYETNLPDRYLDLRLASIMEAGRFGFYNIIAGVSRADHHPTANFNSFFKSLTFDAVLNLKFKEYPEDMTPHEKFELNRIKVFLQYINSGYSINNPFFEEFSSKVLIDLGILLSNYKKSNFRFIDNLVYFYKVLLYIKKGYKLKHDGVVGYRWYSLLLKIFMRNTLLRFLPKIEKENLSLLVDNSWQNELESLSFNDFVKKYARIANPENNEVWPF